MSLEELTVSWRRNSCKQATHYAGQKVPLEREEPEEVGEEMREHGRIRGL